MNVRDAVLDIAGLTVTYPRGFGRSPLVAVSDVSFAVGRGETVSIVGESGSGKTTIGSAILGLQPVAKGSIRLKGIDIARAGRRARQAFRETLQAVFQDPFSSLDPTKTIGHAVGEPLRVARPELGTESARRRVAEILDQVGLDPKLMRPLSRRVLRRPAPAHRDRPGARSQAARSSSATRRSVRSTFRSRRRCSICSNSCSAMKA